MSAIDSDMIQEHLNGLNEADRNPMLAVQMINRENIIKEAKKIEFFENDDIVLFLEQAGRIFPWSKKPQYQYGFCLCANIFLELRAGELLALRWKDVDFDKT